MADRTPEEHSRAMHAFINDYRIAETEERRTIAYEAMLEEVSHFDERLIGLSDEEFVAQDGASTAAEIVNQRLVAQGVKQH